MNLFSLLREIGVPPAGKNAEITNVTDRPEQVTPGTLFVCVRGGAAGSADFAAKALAAGAAAVVSEEPLPIPGAVQVENSRLAFSLLCAAFRGHPERRLKLIGITGTNGKTTTAQYLRRILEGAGRKCAVIGTLGAETGDGPVATGYTTPTPDLFFEALARAADRGNEYCVCEVSSQALSQRRVDGAKFRLGVFTNIGRDHLDYHKTVARLVEAKCRLCGLSERMLLNADDAYHDRFLEACGGKNAYLYSCRAVLSDFAAKNIRLRGERSDFILFNGSELQRVALASPGLFNVYNALAAASAAMLEGVPLETAANLLETLPPVPGRMQFIPKGGVKFCVDFAHTPDALGAALTALRGCTEGKLIAVFGCGGDRDRDKRPVMGEIAARLADAVVLTSDNPRSEDPAAIISQIRAGAGRKKNVFCEPDRRRAIRLAAEKAAPGDIVLVAGKGNETAQIVGGAVLPFSDADEIAAL